jgi:hypothetical protein
MQTGWVGSDSFRIFEAIQICSLRTQAGTKGDKTEIRRAANLHLEVSLSQV